MAKVVDNEKGFKVIEMSLTEIVGAGGLGICDACNTAAFTGYYIAVMNRWYCEKCYAEWLSVATRYEEDASYEKRMFDKMCNRLNLNQNEARN